MLQLERQFLFLECLPGAVRGEEDTPLELRELPTSDPAVYGTRPATERGSYFIPANLSLSIASRMRRSCSLVRRSSRLCAPGRCRVRKLSLTPAETPRLEPNPGARASSEGARGMGLGRAKSALARPSSSFGPVARASRTRRLFSRTFQAARRQRHRLRVVHGIVCRSSASSTGVGACFLQKDQISVSRAVVCLEPRLAQNL